MTHSFNAARGLIVVNARIWGPTGDVVARLALDTGATTSMLNTEMLVAIGYDPAVAAERIRVTTGSGIEYAPQLEIVRIQSLGLERAPMAILAHTLPPTASVDGLLGLDFLRGRRLTTDFRSAIIELD